MNTLPLALKLANQPCLVIGGGDTARRKIEILLAAKANVTVVAKSASAAVRACCESAGLELRERPFEDDDVVGQLLVIAATDDTATNRAAGMREASRPGQLRGRR